MSNPPKRSIVKLSRHTHTQTHTRLREWAINKTLGVVASSNRSVDILVISLEGWFSTTQIYLNRVSRLWDTLEFTFQKNTYKYVCVC